MQIVTDVARTEQRPVLREKFTSLKQIGALRSIGYSTESVDSDTSNIEAELDSVRPRQRYCSCASNMKRINRESITDEFQIRADDPIPEIPSGGARIKVYYAGVCYTDSQMRRSGQRRPNLKGILDTSLFPGYEVAGFIDDICPTVGDNTFCIGDRVVVYPDCEEISDSGYAEYVTVRDVFRNLVKVPDSLSLEVACQLPCGALKAFSAVRRAMPIVEEKSRENTGPINLLIVGAGGLGLWTVKLAQHFIDSDCSKVHVTVADTNLNKLLVAKECGCSDVIHWNDEMYEELLQERTREVCQGGVDLIIDFVSSPRTVKRDLKVLRENGVLLVGGNSWHKVPISIHRLAANNLSVIGIKNGTKEQLQELVNIMSQGTLTAPCYQVFPVDQAMSVFDLLNQSQINGRAILEVTSDLAPLTDPFPSTAELTETC